MNALAAPLTHQPAEVSERAMNDVELRRQLESAHVESFGWAVTCCRGDRDAAEEVLQNVYLSVLDGRASFGGRSTFRTWLFSVIRVTAASQRRTSWLRALLLERKADRIDSQTPERPDARVERESRQDGLRRSMARLAARQREVLQLVFYHELTVEQAAGVMGISVGSARTHYARGKKHLATLVGCPEDL
jgi:RNA polymerase sigma factor (sigma-70 family)